MNEKRLWPFLLTTVFFTSLASFTCFILGVLWKSDTPIYIGIVCLAFTLLMWIFEIPFIDVKIENKPKNWRELKREAERKAYIKKLEEELGIN